MKKEKGKKIVDEQVQKQNNIKMTEKQKNIFVTASIVGVVALNVAISIYQVFKARK